MVDNYAAERVDRTKYIGNKEVGGFLLLLNPYREMQTRT